MWAKVHGAGGTELAQKGLLSLSVLGSGVLLGFLLLPEPQVHAALPVSVRVGGQLVDAGYEPTEQARLLARRYLEERVTLTAGTHRESATRASLGARVDATHLAELLGQAADARSPLRRVHAQVAPQEELSLPMPTLLDEQSAAPWLVRLKDEVDREAVEPRIDAREGKVLPPQDGLELDVYASLERIDHALQTGDTEVPVTLRALPARRDASSFSHIDMSQVLAEFETRYNRSSLSVDRTHNLKVAASKLDGYVLQPGATFDFNAIVGDRTVTNGFKLAPVIADGELSTGMGGGTCQIASTLHAAVFFAGLPIETRFPHSRPSYYIKLGLDATVVYGAQNFVFKNDHTFPIVIGMQVDEGRVYASLHGAARDRTVTLIRRIDATLPFAERVTEDPALPSGLRVLDQRGVPGFSVTRFRVIEDQRTHASVRERSHDNYPPTTQLWRVGKGGEPAPGFERPKNDAHPEYIADEYLSVTQLQARGQYEVTRDTGRSGSYGWTEREGMVSRP